MTPYTRRLTDDRDEAERIVTDLYLPNRLDLRTKSSPLEMEIAGVGLGALTASRLTYGSPVRLRTADAENFHVNVPLTGRAISRSGSCAPVQSARGEAVVFSPEKPAEIAWSADCEQLCLMLRRGAVEEELERLLGRSLGGRLTFDFAADLGGPLGRRWRTVLNLLVEELEDPSDLSRNPQSGRHLEGLVLDGLLLGQSHSHSEAIRRDLPATMRTPIRRAVELIEERPSEPWTTVRLAAEVHLSVRALQEGFRRDLATTPMRHLHQTRLRRARDALRASDPDATTVGAVAAGLGLLHRGRFAAAYQQAFGENPSDTLGRPG